MKISEINEMIQNDSKVDMSNLAEESLRVITLHGKYLGIWNEEKRMLLYLENELNIIKKFKHEYYQGKCIDEIYQNSPLQLKIPKQDLDVYLNSDKELSDIYFKYQRQKDKCDTIKMFIEQNLNQRSHHFRNIIAFLNWTNGK